MLLSCHPTGILPSADAVSCMMDGLFPDQDRVGVQGPECRFERRLTHELLGIAEKLSEVFIKELLTRLWTMVRMFCCLAMSAAVLLAPDVTRRPRIAICPGSKRGSFAAHLQNHAPVDLRRRGRVYCGGPWSGRLWAAAGTK